jgi:predicted O-linked N-acetylglucosamine transferase (SPINDLY family)
LSADFREHPIAHLVAGLFEHHDRSRFRTTGVSLTPDDNSAISQRVRKSFGELIDAERLTDGETIELIKSKEIDILVDLTGLTGGSRVRILSHRPAPIQVNYLGYPGSMGSAQMDYIIADRVLIPPEHQVFYDEKIAYLPHSYQANDRKREISDRHFARDELGLPSSAFVFCCFNNSFKITPSQFDQWMNILKQVDGSVLWLLEANETAGSNLRKEAERRGVDPSRLVFAPRMPLKDHLARHRAADLFLDTLPYNAHTTASDALWAGLPVVTEIGSTFAARVCASLLQAVGLPELITATSEQYQMLAVELARNPAKLRAIKQRLSEARPTAPLFNTELTTRHIEFAYEQMFNRNKAGLPPDHIEIPHLMAP